MDNLAHRGKGNKHPLCQLPDCLVLGKPSIHRKKTCVNRCDCRPVFSTVAVVSPLSKKYQRKSQRGNPKFIYRCIGGDGNRILSEWRPPRDWATLLRTPITPAHRTFPVRGSASRHLSCPCRREESLQAHVASAKPLQTGPERTCVMLPSS